MTTISKRGIVFGTIVFTIFMIPWLGFLVKALVTDPTGFNAESIIGTILGIIVFAFVAAFLGFSIAQKSILLVTVSTMCVIAVPVLWYFMPWLP